MAANLTHAQRIDLNLGVLGDATAAGGGGGDGASPRVNLRRNDGWTAGWPPNMVTKLDLKVPKTEPLTVRHDGWTAGWIPGSTPHQGDGWSSRKAQRRKGGSGVGDKMPGVSRELRRVLHSSNSAYEGQLLLSPAVGSLRSGDDGALQRDDTAFSAGEGGTSPMDAEEGGGRDAGIGWGCGGWRAHQHPAAVAGWLSLGMHAAYLAAFAALFVQGRGGTAGAAAAGTVPPLPPPGLVAAVLGGKGGGGGGGGEMLWCLSGGVLAALGVALPGVRSGLSLGGAWWAFRGLRRRQRLRGAGFAAGMGWAGLLLEAGSLAGCFCAAPLPWLRWDTRLDDLGMLRGARQLCACANATGLWLARWLSFRLCFASGVAAMRSSAGTVTPSCRRTLALWWCACVVGDVVAPLLATLPSSVPGVGEASRVGGRARSWVEGVLGVRRAVFVLQLVARGVGVVGVVAVGGGESKRLVVESPWLQFTSECQRF
jgi:hypothetical protein